MLFSFFAILACLAASHASKYEDIYDMWSFDVGAGRGADWMSTIADDTALSSLSIPGTHNSMTYHIDDSLLHTQNVYLADQLTGGIRYIDITCKYQYSKILVYHGRSNTGYDLLFVLDVMFDFLQAHPRETIILRIQRGGILEDSETFFQHFDKYIGPGSSFNPRAAQRIYTASSTDITRIPTLGELRGKVFILQDFKTERPGRYGLPWNSNTVDNYNHKVSLGGLFIKSKWKGVKSHLRKAPSPDSNKLRITHTTASVGVSPINIAARKSPGVGMNAFLGKYLLGSQVDCFGIVVMDFPGRFLVEKILELNDRYRTSESANLPSDNTEDVTVEAGSRSA
ncbi:1-phosphatidylinositol phosphodiesterase [Ceratocystis lukuohia]|uniref:1-phosphatidylinositol phosphodiesterase n=1 Tax=Ceratocystis lukuohia TaxID=2019550 RepID=A0ABR4MAD3_9PEZI